MHRIALLTVLSLIAFAANSLLCRTALRPHAIDPATFTGVRLVSGAVVLAVLVALRRSKSEGTEATFRSAAALFAYAIAFSLAYVALDTGTGALLLFGSVQLTMIAWAIRSGVRPSALEWIGFVGAFGGLVVLTLPSVTAPPPLAAASMVAAGVAWGIYTLRGRGMKDPLAATSGNFTRAIVFFPVLVIPLVWRGAHVSPAGVLLAAASGAIASGLGYSLWYAALRGLTATRAALLQLSVPLLAAFGGVLVLGERATPRLVIAGGAIVGGIAVALVARKR
jgi:drug/metabolite transporter (DMT)-like permease